MLVAIFHWVKVVVSELLEPESNNGCVFCINISCMYCTLSVNKFDSMYNCVEAIASVCIDLTLLYHVLFNL